MDKLLVICGPTATGKTALAVSLAKQFNGELISADSRQVYKKMDIVTGKDLNEKIIINKLKTKNKFDNKIFELIAYNMNGIPIWLYDVVAPDEAFSVSQWVKLARAAIVDILKRSKLPIVVGGTGLYIKALLYPFETIDIPPNKTLRKKLQKLSILELQNMVTRSTMNDSDWNNSRRLIRKIEIAKFAKRLSLQQRQSFHSLIIGLTAPIPVLDSRIDERFKKRIQQRMEKEIEGLVKTYRRDLPSMSAIGLNEHAYARRQLTWFKKQKGVHWFDITDSKIPAKIAALVCAWYTGR